MAEQWIQSARKKMESKGTVGAFGKATGKKIAAGKANDRCVACDRTDRPHTGHGLCSACYARWRRHYGYL
jgi:hypothetical protein